MILRRLFSAPVPCMVGRRPRWTAALLLGISLVGTVAPRRAQALECTGDSAKICPSSPCVINGIHTFDAQCTLDFTGKDVTIASSASLFWPSRPAGSGATVIARSLTIQGTVQAPNTTLEFDVDQDFRVVGPGPAKIVLTAAGYPVFFTGLNIFAFGDVVLDGSIVQAPYVDITGANVTVDSRIVANTYLDESPVIFIEAANSVITRGKLSVVGQPFPSQTHYGAGAIIQLMSDGGDVEVDGPILARSDFQAPELDLSAAGNVHVNGQIKLVGPVTQNTAGANVFGDAQGDFSLDGKLIARPRSQAGVYHYGTIVEIGVSGTLSIGGKLDVSAHGSASLANPSMISLEACSISISGTINTGGNLLAPVEHEIAYGKGLDFTRGRWIATPNGSLAIDCPCVDADSNGVCDGGCVPPPTGLDPARIRLPVSFSGDPSSSACP